MSSVPTAPVHADSGSSPAPAPISSSTRRQLLHRGTAAAGVLGVSSLAAACGSSTKSTAHSATSSGTGGSAAAAGSGATTTLQIWSWFNEDAAVFPAVTAAYQAHNPKVKLQFRVFPFANYTPALQAAFSAGSEPDIFAPATLTLSLGAAKKSLDVKKAFGQPFINQFFDSANSESVYNDGQYALGWEAQAFGVFYNKELLSKAGVTAPETWDDLIAAAAPIRAKTGVTPMSLQGTPNNGLGDFFLPFITQVTNDPQTVLDLDAHTKSGVRWNSAPVIDALTVVEKLVKGNVFDPGILGIDGTACETNFYGSKAAMVFIGSWFPQALQAGAPKAFLSQYGISKTPTIKAGAKHWCANQAGATLSLSASSKNQEAAVAFLEWLYEPARYVGYMNQSFSVPSTKAAVAKIQNPDVKLMTQWLLDGEGSPHILYGTGSGTAVDNGVESIFQGKATPAQAAAQIEAAVKQSRSI